MAHIMSKPIVFHKPKDFTLRLLALIGPGFFAAEGDDHRRHRKILNPAFNMQQLRLMAETTMMSKSAELRSILLKEVSMAPPGQPVDILNHLSRMAMDIIGETGFGYQFNSQYRDGEELAKAFNDLAKSTSSTDPIRLLSYHYPIVGILPLERFRAIARSRATMDRVGRKIVAEKMEELGQQEGAAKDELLGKDLLSVLIKSNMSESENRLSDEELIAQIAGFILGGHDTTAGESTWALYALSKDHRVQEKLRQEILSIDTDTPTLDQINSLTYLDYVVKETLRLHPAVTALVRSPVKDEVIPLSESVIDSYGKTVNEIMIPAGETIYISLASFLWAEKYWSVDSGEFKPERHANPPETVHGVPSVVGHLTTFDYGQRGCIAWRFAIYEMKVVLPTLLRAFKFDIDPKLVIKKRAIVSSTPFVEGDEQSVPLPLKISLYKP